MRILTWKEKQELLVKIRDAAEEEREKMTPERLAVVHKQRHQGARERARRLRQTVTPSEIKGSGS